MLYFKDREPGPYLKLLYQYKYRTIFDYLREKYQYYQFLGSRITIDKVMLRFEGRTLGSTIILGKPIPVGFKIFALADEGFI